MFGDKEFNTNVLKLAKNIGAYRVVDVNYIFERPNWLYYDNSANINRAKKLAARTSAYLRFGSYLPFISINDRNFNSKVS